MNNEIQKDEFILPGDLGSVSLGNGDIRRIQSVFKRNDGVVTIAIGPKEQNNEPAVTFLGNSDNSLPLAP